MLVLRSQFGIVSRIIQVTVRYGSGTVGTETASVQIWDELGPRGGSRRWWRRTGSELWQRTLRDAARSATGGTVLRVRYTRDLHADC